MVAPNDLPNNRLLLILRDCNADDSLCHYVLDFEASFEFYNRDLPVVNPTRIMSNGENNKNCLFLKLIDKFSNPPPDLHHDS